MEFDIVSFLMGCSTSESTSTKITVQPSDTAVEVEAYAYFTIAAEGESLSYQWQYSSDGGSTWLDSRYATATNSTLRITAKSNYDGWMYRCVVTDSDGQTFISHSATLTVTPSFEIVGQPVDYIGRYGDTATFVVEATGQNLQYRWQYSNNSGQTWNNVEEGESGTTNQLSTDITDVKLLNIYRCVIHDVQYNTLITETVRIVEAVTITKQPVDFYGSIGGTTQFSVVAEGEELTYQWQWLNTSGQWKDQDYASFKVPVLKVSITAERIGYTYRCRITDKFGLQAISDEVILRLSTPLSITEHPQDTSGELGSTFSMHVSAEGDGLTYQWQWYNGMEWADTSIGGAKTSTISDEITEERNGVSYRCVVTDQYNNAMTSDGAKMYACAIETTPYVSRSTGGQLSVRDSSELRQIIGCTIGWNQLVPASAKSAAPTLPTSGAYDVTCANDLSIPVLADHIYLTVADLSRSISDNDRIDILLWIQDGGYLHASWGRDTENGVRAGISHVDVTGTINRVSLNNYSGKRGFSSGDTASFDNLMLLDLTAMFGSTIANYLLSLSGMGALAKLLEWSYNINNYHANTAVTLESVGTIAKTTKNAAGYIIGRYAIDPIMLRGVPKLDANNNLYYYGDTYTSEGIVTRKFGTVDLGTLTWTKIGTAFYSSDINNLIKCISKYETPDGICENYTPIAWSSSTPKDGDYAVAENGRISFRNSAFDKASDFRASVDGVTLVYELATPTTETTAPYQQIQDVDPDGTETFIDAYVDEGTRDIAIPVGHTTLYSLQIKPVITDQPVDYEGYIGDTATFTVVAMGEGLTYQWYWYNGTKWQTSGMTGNKTATLSGEINTGRLTYLYHCEITDKYGNKVTSNEVRMVKKEAALEITQQPVDYEGAVGDTATFTVVAEGEGLSYQWEWKPISSGESAWSVTSVPGNKTATATPQITEERYANEYRCVITDKDGNMVTSDAARIVRPAGITIVTQPVDYEGAIGDTATFTVVASGDGLTYQWQFHNGTKWTTSTSTGAKTATLSTEMTEARLIYQYRCIVKDTHGNTLTTNAVRMIEAAPAFEITSQPVDYEGAIGDTATFTVVATGEDLIYQWYFKSRTAGDEAWEVSPADGNDTATLTLSITAKRMLLEYRCVITDAHGTTLTTDTVRIVEPQA